MTNKKLPRNPSRPQKEDGDFNRRYAVPVTLVGSVFLTWLIIVIAGLR